LACILERKDSRFNEESVTGRRYAANGQSDLRSVIPDLTSGPCL
jgi:hypothetical protein